MIKDTWYKVTSGKDKLDKPWYIKFDRIDDLLIRSSNHIDSEGNFSICDGNFGPEGCYSYSEIPLSEIQQWLPKDHLDLLPKEPNYEIY